MATDSPAKGLQGFVLHSHAGDHPTFRQYSSDRKSFADFDIATSLLVRMLRNAVVYDGPKGRFVDYPRHALTAGGRIDNPYEGSSARAADGIEGLLHQAGPSTTMSIDIAGVRHIVRHADLEVEIVDDSAVASSAVGDVGRIEVRE